MENVLTLLKSKYWKIKSDVESERYEMEKCPNELTWNFIKNNEPLIEEYAKAIEILENHPNG